MRKPVPRRVALWTAAGLLVVAPLGVWAVARAVHDTTEPFDELVRLHRLEERLEASMPRGAKGARAIGTAGPPRDPSADPVSVTVTPTERGTEVRVGERRWVLPRAEAERAPVLALVRAEIAREAEARVAKGRRVSARLVTPTSDPSLLADDVAVLMDAILGAGIRDVELAPAPEVPPEAPAPAGR